MKKSNNLPISSFLLGRTRLIEIIISAVFIGFGISLTASSLSLLDKFSPLIGLYLGLFICSFSIIFIAYKIFGRKVEEYSYKAFFILNEKKNKILNIEGYSFSESLSKYFRTAFAENKALEYIWSTEPLLLQNQPKIPEPRSMNLIRESIEYFLLDNLTTHLIDYFKFPAKSGKNICVFERDKIPSILLKNRFLELFSRPMEDREAFNGIYEMINQDEKTYILEVDGAIYRKFEMVLPFKSQIRRDNNEILIQTRRFTISLKVKFDGTNTVLPYGFQEHYLSIYGFEDSLVNVIYDVEVVATVKFKLCSFFSLTGWNDYNWIDSFLGKLDESLSKTNFFERINWNIVYPIIKCLDNK